MNLLKKQNNNIKFLTGYWLSIISNCSRLHRRECGVHSIDVFAAVLPALCFHPAFLYFGQIEDFLNVRLQDE